MTHEGEISVGIGFATGRRSFQSVLGTFIYHLEESGLLNNRNIHLNLLVAYDLTYSNTCRTDYTRIGKSVAEKLDHCYFIGEEDIRAAEDELAKKEVIPEDKKNICFGTGYARQRNSVVYTALKNGIDYLIFLDDDEYPMAVTESKDFLLWSGQHVLESHVKSLRTADITNGYHCGYITPIPYIEFDHILSEEDFKTFIEAMSNDVLNWETAKETMRSGGITYADKTILIEQKTSLAEEVNGAKFITGGNLGINLTSPERLFPFYNPPGARGEDTFLSTCLKDVNVKHIPSYTFHDGFAYYRHLLKGVLPNVLKPIDFGSEEVINRFYGACLGWTRYKPLYMYITRRSEFDAILDEMQEKMEQVLPKLCSYFNRPEFLGIAEELRKYRANAPRHFEEFEETKRLFERVKEYALGE